MWIFQRSSALRSSVSRGPASSNKRRHSGSSVSLLASTQPADPAPTTILSNSCGSHPELDEQVDVEKREVVSFRLLESRSSVLFIFLKAKTTFIRISCMIVLSVKVRAVFHVVVVIFLKEPSHQIKLGSKCYGWISHNEYKDRRW
jgi:hypothetical protein